MKGTCTTQSSKWAVLTIVLIGGLSLPAIATESQLERERLKVQSSEQESESQLAELVEQFNGLMREQRFSEAGVIAKQARELAPDDAVTLSMELKSRFAERQKKAEKDKDTTEGKTDQTRSGSYRVKVTVDEAESPKKPIHSASLEEVLRHIEKDYYGEVDRSELEYAAIKAILAKLDDKSAVLTPDEFGNITTIIDGELVGVGIAIHLDSESKKPVVTKPIRHSPALAAGIRKDDVIHSIDGKSTDGLKLSELVSQIRGKQGTKITLGIQRGDEKLDVVVTRKRFELSLANPWSASANGQEVFWADKDSGIGYLHIPSFTRNTASQVRRIVSDLRKEDMKGLVLDLRNCGGGLLTAAVEVVDMFLDEGEIVSSKSRNNVRKHSWKASAGGEFIDLPLVVLINGYTASAAEIVAASLQDHHRATMVGQQTFGKGSVQSLFKLQDGGALKLTTAAWLRPNGKTLERREDSRDWGVRPDAGMKVELKKEEHRQLVEQMDLRLVGETVDERIEDRQLARAVAFLKLD